MEQRKRESRSTPIFFLSLLRILSLPLTLFSSSPTLVDNVAGRTSTSTIYIGMWKTSFSSAVCHCYYVFRLNRYTHAHITTASCREQTNQKMVCGSPGSVSCRQRSQLNFLDRNLQLPQESSCTIAVKRIAWNFHPTVHSSSFQVVSLKTEAYLNSFRVHWPIDRRTHAQRKIFSSTIPSALLFRISIPFEIIMAYWSY